MGKKVVVWNITRQCNLRCKHCYDFEELGMQDNADFEKKKKIVDALHLIGITNIVISGGEPFSLSYLLDLAEYITQKGISLNIATNGLLITDEKIVRIKKANVSCVLVSIDGLESTHNFIRGEGTFARTIASIRKMLTSGISIVVNTTINKMNKNQLPELFSYLDGIGVSQVNIKRYIEMGGALTNADILRLSNEELRQTYEIIAREKEKRVDSLRIEFKDPLFILTNKYRDFLAETETCKKGCLAGTHFFGVSEEGDLYPCTKLRIKICNLLEDDIQEKVQNSLYFKNFDELRGDCKTCKYYLVCGGCLAAVYHKYKSYGHVDPGCWLYKKDDSQKLNIELKTTSLPMYSG